MNIIYPEDTSQDWYENECKFCGEQCEYEFCSEWCRIGHYKENYN